MSQNAPWSVKGIDAKAREVAKALARRSGMTLGEWLNQMILEGQDVGALIRAEDRAQASRAPQPAPLRQPAPQRSRGRYVPDSVYADDDEEDDVRDGYYVDEPQRRGGYESIRRQAPEPRASRQNFGASDLRRRSIFDESLREADYGESRAYDGAASDLGRVARALEALGSRIETSETRSASAVRSVSSVVEGVLGRLERAEAMTDERLRGADERLRGQEEETQASRERLRRAEADQTAMASRLEQAERLIDAQAERLEGLSGHLREERERVGRLTAEVKSSQVVETVKVVEGALGKLANQLYENDARTRDTLKDVRDQVVGLSHRLSQVESQDPERAAQGLIDKVVSRLAQRLEAAEAQTTGAIRTLEKAFASLDARLARTEETGDVTDPEAVQSFSRLASELSRKVDSAREELFSALSDGRGVSGDALARLEARIEAAEARSAGAIEKLGQDVLRVAEGLNRKIATVDATSRQNAERAVTEIRKVSDSVEQRFSRSESGHVQALERLGTEIARISERLNARLAESERRTAQVLGGVSREVEQQRDQVREDMAERLREVEERTQRLIDEARTRMDQKVAQGLTQNLLNETVIKPQVAAVASERANEVLPNPFAFDEPAPAASAFASPEPVVPLVAAPVRGAFADDDHKVDLTGRLLDAVADLGDDFKPEFDPFEDDEFAAELTPLAPAGAAAPEVVASDDDPFADIDQSRKTAPRGRDAAPVMPARAQRRDPIDYGPDPDEALLTPRPASRFDDDDPVSVSTRDALAAARAAVRASLDGGEDKNPLSGLKAAPARTRAAPEKPEGNTLLRALKASSLAAVLAAAGVGGYVVLRNDFSGDKATPAADPLAATAVTAPEDEASREQRLREQYAEAMQAVEANAEGAIDKLKAVANLGYAPAQYDLGRIYQGQGRRVTPDKAEARLWMQKAASGGEPWAMFYLGNMFYGGDGGPQDRSMAAMWFRKAAERGIADAQYNLGVLYQQGDGVPMNPSEAYKWLSLAAKGGDEEARRAAEDIKGQLTEAQRLRADDAITHFTPISDGPSSAVATAN